MFKNLKLAVLVLFFGFFGPGDLIAGKETQENPNKSDFTGTKGEFVKMYTTKANLDKESKLEIINILAEIFFNRVKKTFDFIKKINEKEDEQFNDKDRAELDSLKVLSSEERSKITLSLKDVPLEKRSEFAISCLEEAFLAILFATGRQSKTEREFIEIGMLLTKTKITLEESLRSDDFLKSIK